jgi:phosphate acyltransferase
MAETVRFLLRQSLQATITRQVGFMLSRQAFVDFKKRLDYSEYGGAPLLGVKGVCIISHGSSNANAIKNAIRVASEFASSEMNTVIEKEIAAAGGRLDMSSSRSAAPSRTSQLGLD